MLILASGSPRRQELLHLITDDFVVRPTETDETLPAGILPEEAVRLLAERKARAAAAAAGSDAVILGADTVVALDGHILGKPRSHAQAFAMLTALAGRTHRVFTGVALLCGGQCRSFVSGAAVTFSPMSDTEIEEYLATGEPFDKAGAYGIQGCASRYIEKIDGDYFAVVGLPVHALYRALTEMQENRKNETPME